MSSSSQEWEMSFLGKPELLVKSEIRSRRISICESCSKLKHFVCKESRTFMPAAIGMTFGQCPDKKW